MKILYPKKLVQLLLAVLFSSFLGVAQAQVETVIHSFTGKDGANPAALLSDSAGNLYGITGLAGDSSNTTCTSSIGNGCGTVFRLVHSDSGWQETTLYRFTGESDGRSPIDLAIDAAGNLYGVAQQGGDGTVCGPRGCGTVFELKPGSSGWQFRRLHSFTGSHDGSSPNSIALDASGNLYVTAQTGGNTDCNGQGCGTLLRLQATSSGFQPSTIHVFDWTQNNQRAANPESQVIFDPAGNLYGVAGGGSYNDVWSQTFGVVYELSPTPVGQWKETVLYSFCPGVICGDGAFPIGKLTFDSAGNLFGTTLSGGAPGSGNVFELAQSAGSWTESSLYAFTGGSDGGLPVAPLSFDSAGSLYGTTSSGGDPNCYCGVTFKLTPTAGSWSERVLHSFTGTADGSYPGAVFLNSSGTLYGTTAYGGLSAPPCSLLCGVAYEIGRNAP
jgi:uncharacterized repeat protein (TIGR03803 family)